MYSWEEPEDGELEGAVGEIIKTQRELTEMHKKLFGIVKETIQAITDIEARLDAIERPRFEDVETILN